MFKTIAVIAGFLVAVALIFNWERQVTTPVATVPSTTIERAAAAAPPHSPTTISPSSGEDAFLLALRQEIPLARVADDQVLVEAGHRACDAVRTAEGDPGEVRRGLATMAGSQQLVSEQELGLMLETAVETLCPEYLEVVRQATSGP